jgi:aminoglycoside phosphotransferase (APT) family kinase protein
VFRSQIDFETGTGEKFNVAKALEREKFFYNNINNSISKICPEVYVVDGTREHFDESFCVMEYIEGTPLNLCFDNFNEEKKNEILYQIGSIAAKINSVEIEDSHPYIRNRKSWEDYIADRLYDRFIPLIISEVITKDEAFLISNNIRSKKAIKNLSFLHLDMRRTNMIYNNGNIYVIDAENCDFGDPLFELAVIDCGNELEQPLINGYKNTYTGHIDMDNELYYYYKMERMALVLHLFMNLIKSDTKATQKYLDVFNELKHRLAK